MIMQISQILNAWGLAEKYLGIPDFKVTGTSKAILSNTHEYIDRKTENAIFAPT